MVKDAKRRLAQSLQGQEKEPAAATDRLARGLHDKGGRLE